MQLFVLYRHFTAKSRSESIMRNTSASFMKLLKRTEVTVFLICTHLTQEAT